MRSFLGLLMVFALALSTTAQAYRYHFAPGWGYSNGYYYHASTAAEGYLNGYAAFVRSLGMYNLDTAMANKIYQEAYTEYLHNRYLRAQTYFELKKLHDEYVKSTIHRLTPEQLEKIAKDGLPARLSPEQWNKKTLTFRWPFALQADGFQDNCEALTKLFAERETNPENSGVDSENYFNIKMITDSMKEDLKAQIRKLPTEQYIRAKNFLNTLAYEARFVNGQN